MVSLVVPIARSTTRKNGHIIQCGNQIFTFYGNIVIYSKIKNLQFLYFHLPISPIWELPLAEKPLF